MPNIDPDARRWEESVTERVGLAVKARRKALGLTAVDLSARTENLGYPITRVMITNIENNKRNGKLDVSELFALAVALNIPPALLLFPGYPQGGYEVVPGVFGNGVAAAKWLAGLDDLPPNHVDGRVELRDHSPGVDLIRRVTERDSIEQFLTEMHGKAFAKDNRQTVQATVDRLVLGMAELDRDITQAHDEIWYGHSTPPQADE